MPLYWSLESTKSNAKPLMAIPSFFETALGSVTDIKDIFKM